MSLKREHNLIFYLKRFAVAVGMALLFSFISLYPGLGYDGKAEVRIVSTSYQLLYRDIEVNCNITYNPLLFPLSWLINKGQSSYYFVMRTAPSGAGQFGITWSSLEEAKEDALLIVVLNELFINIPFLLSIFLAVELINVRSIYLCFLGGILGFLITSSLGAIVGFLLVLSIVVLLIMKYKVKRFVDWQIFSGRENK